MSINQCTLVDMYVNQKLGTPEISKRTGICKSMVRHYLIKAGIKLRTRKEALALVKDKLGSGRRGKPFAHSEGSKKKISEARKKYSELHSKGYDTHNGYIRLSTGENCGRCQHIVIMEQHIGRRLLKGEVVHHINGIKTDNRIENLILMTNSEHSRLHAMQNCAAGRCYDISKESRSGELHPKAKLTAKQVDEIRQSTESQRLLALKYNVSKSAIKHIKSNRNWRTPKCQ